MQEGNSATKTGEGEKIGFDVMFSELADTINDKILQRMSLRNKMGGKELPLIMANQFIPRLERYFKDSSSYTGFEDDTMTKIVEEAHVAEESSSTESEKGAPGCEKKSVKMAPRSGGRKKSGGCRPWSRTDWKKRTGTQTGPTKIPSEKPVKQVKSSESIAKTPTDLRPPARNIFRYVMSEDKDLQEKYIVKNYEQSRIKVFVFNTLSSRWSNMSTVFRTKKEVYYDDGHLAATFEKNGTAIINNLNGSLAIQITEISTGKLIIVFSEMIENVQENVSKVVPVAIFDQHGNGIVYDMEGNMRLKYDQAEGVLYDNPSKGGGPISWKWGSYNRVKKRREELALVLPEGEYEFETEAVGAEQRQTSSTKLSTKGTASKSRASTSVFSQARSLSQSTMNYQKSLHSRRMRFLTRREANVLGSIRLNERLPLEEPSEKVEPILKLKPIVLKITDLVTLRIMGQDQIYLMFRRMKTHFKIRLGVKIDTSQVKSIISSDRLSAVNTGIISYFEAHPTKSKNLAKLNYFFNFLRKTALAKKHNREIKTAQTIGYPKGKMKEKPIRKTVPTFLSNDSSDRAPPPNEISEYEDSKESNKSARRKRNKIKTKKELENKLT